tara:strand:- start:678 stop:974 length:297 start_codon:yes stop_codon:yes gene_type:complete
LGAGASVFAGAGVISLSQLRIMGARVSRARGREAMRGGRRTAGAGAVGSGGAGAGCRSKSRNNRKEFFGTLFWFFKKIGFVFVDRWRVCMYYAQPLCV